jgi:hypothetical protein
MKLNDLFNVTSKNYLPFCKVPIDQVCQVFTWNGQTVSKRPEYQSILLTKKNEYSGALNGTGSRNNIFAVAPNELVKYIPDETPQSSIK